jgi:hypothetical protein
MNKVLYDVTHHNSWKKSAVTLIKTYARMRPLFWLDFQFEAVIRLFPKSVFLYVSMPSFRVICDVTNGFLMDLRAVLGLFRAVLLSFL